MTMKDDTLLLRQIHPNFLQDDRPSSQAFRPTPKDQHQLSVYDGDQIEPDVAFRHYTEAKQLLSVGVLGISVGECSELDLPARLDPDPFPEHAVIDFSGFGKNAVEKKAKLLRHRAVNRGWQYKKAVQK